MEEEKAAAYYEEMRRRGGGAAKLKQGLGYASSAETPSKPAFLSFVRGDSHADSLAKLEKENRLAAVRDKLQRGPVYRTDVDHDPANVDHYGGHKSPYHASRERDHTYKRERGYEGGRSYDNSAVSSSPCRTEHGSRGPSSSLDSHQRRCNGRHSDYSLSVSFCRKSSSRSRSPERRRKRERESSSSRESYLVSGKHSQLQGGIGRVMCKSGSLRGEGGMRNESGAVGTRSLRKRSTCDFYRIIPGFDNMTRAEKVRAKMKFQLSETASKDTAKGIGNEWERFTFNNTAPLDDDVKLDYFGDGTGSYDDIGFLQNTGSTFLSTYSQAKREAQIQAAHDDAIFGPSVGMSHEKMGSHSLFTAALTIASDQTVRIDKAPAIKDLLNEKVLNLKQGSWRERVLKLKEQGGANTSGIL